MFRLIGFDASFELALAVYPPEADTDTLNARFYHYHSKKFREGNFLMGIFVGFEEIDRETALRYFDSRISPIVELPKIKKFVFPSLDAALTWVKEIQNAHKLPDL